MSGVIHDDVQHVRLNLWFLLNNQQAWHLIRYRCIKHFNDFWDALLQIQIRNLMSYQTLIIIQQKHILVLPKPFLRLLVQQILLDLVKLIILE